METNKLYNELPKIHNTLVLKLKKINQILTYIIKI